MPIRPPIRLDSTSLVGFQFPNNDFTFFLDPSEVGLLDQGDELIGRFLTFYRKPIQLTLKVDDAACNKAMTLALVQQLSEDNVVVSTLDSVRQSLIDNGSSEPRLGWCRLRFKDVLRLHFSDQMNYEALLNAINGEDAVP